MVQFDAASIAAKTATLRARTLGFIFSLTQESTTLLFVANRVPGAELVRPRSNRRVLLSVEATYRSPNRAMPVAVLPGADPAYDTAGGLQRHFGPVRIAGRKEPLDPLCFSLVVDDEPSAVLVGTGLLLDFLQTNFDRLDQQSNAGRAPVRFP